MGRQGRRNARAAGQRFRAERFLSRRRDPLLRALDAQVASLASPGSRWLVAVSGGVDSSVLLHALTALAPRHGLDLAVAHVDHGLRGEDSIADARFVRELADKLGVPFACRRVDPGTLREGRSSRDRPTVQEAARSLRHRALEALRVELGCDRIATAHNADDQAETLLLRILRGCGPDALGAMPEISKDGRIVRPMLGIPRSEIAAYAERNAVPFREDASNADPKYTRNRLRHHWLPGLTRDFNPQLLRAMANLAEAQRRDGEWIEQLVAEAAAERIRVVGEELHMSRGGWAELPEALARRLARRAIEHFGGGRDVTRIHLERVTEFLRTATNGTTLELPGGLRVSCDSGHFRLFRTRVEAETPC